jgi:hypothetical protein
MNLDFRKLSRADQIKAINNVIERDSVSWLAFLIKDQCYEVFSWFPLNNTNEGEDYWINLKKEQKNDCKV